MGKTYNSIEEYLAAVEAAIPTAMMKSVAPKVEDILAIYTIMRVYAVYHPKAGGWVRGTTYQRRMALAEGIVSWMEGDELNVTSEAAPNTSITGKAVYGGRDGGFYTMLASGRTGLWRNGFPRPVIPEAQAFVDANIDTLTSYLVEGLEEML